VVIKTFEIKYDGVSETVEYETDIKYGEMEAILSHAIDLSDVSKPKVDIPQYRMSLLVKVLRKAPFPVGDTNAIRQLTQSQATEIMKEVMKDYPLAKYLGDWVETFTGSQIDYEQDIRSTTSVQ
jgi:hypothetical protein|tara:strand:- start:225 stop:596 length:372 start_codon:yes stop_codon:yes gene_type:complete